jgi:hypothetical protein
MIQSCSKSNAETENPVIEKKYETVVQELSLKLSFDFVRANPDNFQIKLSDNFSLTQSSSLYNPEQDSEFFFLNCKNILDNQSYLIYGNVDSKGKIDIMHFKAKF